MRTRDYVPRGALAVLLVAGLASGGCTDEQPSGPTERGPQLSCSVPSGEIYDGGVGFNGIPALVEPSLSTPGGPDLAFLEDTTRVIGLEAGGQAVAVPFNVLWWHEIVNLDVGGEQLAATYCPLTGSSLVFERGAVDGRPFLVSGLLWRNNLVMTTRQEERSLFMQMSRQARCGPALGTELTMHPAVEVRWSAWRRMHPETRVVDAATGHDRNYRTYPYGAYRSLGNDATLFPHPPIDRRRAPKERVLGIPNLSGGIAFPFLALERAAEVAVARTTVRDDEVVVLWRAAAWGAAAFRPVVTGLPAGDPDQGRRVTLRVEANRFVDDETGSTWELDGRAVEGPLAGARLERVSEAYTAFWFAWATFQPDTRIWTPDGEE